MLKNIDFYLFRENVGGFLGNKSADPDPKSNDNKIVKVRNN